MVFVSVRTVELLVKGYVTLALSEFRQLMICERNREVNEPL